METLQAKKIAGLGEVKNCVGVGGGGGEEKNCGGGAGVEKKNMLRW